MNKETVLAKLLDGLRNDRMESLEEFKANQDGPCDFYDKVEIAHEFLDLLTFKIKESKSSLDKESLCQFSLAFLRQTLRAYHYNHKFVSAQCKALITYYQNQKNLDKAIEVCEFLIVSGITDDDAKGFHFRLDELYRLKKKLEEKGLSPQDLHFAPIVEEDSDD